VVEQNAAGNGEAGASRRLGSQSSCPRQSAQSMMMRARRSSGITHVGSAALAVLAVAFFPGVGRAQTSKSSVAVSYSLLHDAETGDTYALGGSLAGTIRLHGWLAGTVEISASSLHEDFAATGGGTYDQRYQSLQAGPRLSLPARRVRPYLELLVGATRHGIWERRLDLAGEWGSPVLSLQPGLGVDVFLSRRVAVRLGGDLRVLFKQDTRFDTGYRTRLYRLDLGVAFHFGTP
jgi:hypothetical protein